MKKYIRLLSTGFVPCLLMISAAKGELLVYEGFNYGLADNTTIDGALTNATGLSGNYAVVNNSANASSNYSTSGLSFGSSFFATAGGALNQKANNASATYAGAALDTDAVSGDLWGSYLFNYDAVNSVNSTGQVRLNTTATGGSGTAWFNSASDISGTNKYPQISYNGSSSSNQSSFAFAVDTTYLMLMHYSNVGVSLSGGTPGVASLWLFSQANYETWVAGGGLEASLTSEADGFISRSATSGSYDFDDFLQSVAFSQGSSGLSLYTDELRFGTNLDDVVAIPEPSSLLMLFGGMSLLALALRRRV